MVGSVSTEMNGSRACASCVRLAVVLAICIRDISPSCMRAPPLAVKQMKGIFCSMADADPAHEALAHHRSHGAAHEAEFEGGHHHRNGLDGTLHHHQRVGLPGLGRIRLQAFGIAPAVHELEEIHRHHFRADLVAAFGVQRDVEPLARGDAVVVGALGTDVEALLEVGAVEHRLAHLALDPEPLGDRLLRGARAALDLGGEKLLQPAHVASGSVAAASPQRRFDANRPDPTRSRAGITRPSPGGCHPPGTSRCR